jgi:hypothetical protein
MGQESFVDPEVTVTDVPANTGGSGKADTCWIVGGPIFSPNNTIIEPWAIVVL